jgi:hypothetical protein
VWTQSAVILSLLPINTGKYSLHACTPLADDTVLVFSVYIPCLFPRVYSRIFHVYSMLIPCLFHVHFMFIPGLFPVYSMFISCLFQVYSMFIPCLFHVYSMFIPCSFHVYSMFIPCLFHVYSMWIPLDSMLIKISFKLVVYYCNYNYYTQYESLPNTTK